MKHHIPQLKKRRAVDTILGMFFFIAVIIGSFGAFLVLIDTNENLFETQMEIAKSKIEKTEEDFKIFAYSNSSGFDLQVDVENTGEQSLKISSLWIINKSSADCPPCDANIIEIDFRDSSIPITKTSNILENTPLTLSSGVYDLKVVTSNGNSKVLPFRTGSFSLSSKLISIPPLISTAQNVTLMLTVQNNSSKTLYDVTPSDPTVNPLSSLDGGGFTQNAPFSIEQLDPNESTIFTWNYELRGASGTKVTFTTNATAKKESNSANWDVISNNAETRMSFLASVEESNIIKEPEIFVILPNPAGKFAQQAGQGDDTRGFWGTVIANTSNQTITVHQVTIAMQITTQGPDKVIDKDEDARQHIWPCCLLGVDLLTNDSYRDANAPGGAPKGPDGKDDPIGQWTVPENNVLLWNEDPSNPIQIPPNNATEFILKIKAVGGGSASGVDTFIVTANVNTNEGQFTNTGHTTTIEREKPKSSVINVYPTSVNRTTDPTLDGSGYGEVESPEDGDGNDCYERVECRFYDGALRYRDDDFNATRAIDSGETGRYYITIREGHKHDRSFIPGTEETLGDLEQIYQAPNNLVISFPPGFPAITYNTQQNGWGTPVLKTFGDDSQQIIVPIEIDIGDDRDTSQSAAAQQVDAERLSFEFCVTAPDLEDTTLFVFLAFGEGRDNEGHIIGPLAEAIVLQVIGTNDPAFGNIEDQASDCVF